MTDERLVEAYVQKLQLIHSSGVGVPETSFCPAARGAAAARAAARHELRAGEGDGKAAERGVTGETVGRFRTRRRGRT